MYTLLIKMGEHVITQLRGGACRDVLVNLVTLQKVEITMPLLLIRLLILTSQTHATDLFDEDIDLVFEVRGVIDDVDVGVPHPRLSSLEREDSLT